MPGQVSTVRNGSVEALREASSSDDIELMTLAHMLVVYKLALLEEEYGLETEVIGERKKRLDFLNKVHRLYNSSLVDDRGGMELKGAEYEELLNEAKAMQAEIAERRERADELDREIASLNPETDADLIKKLKKEAAANRQSADELTDTVNASGLLGRDKTKFSRDERDRMIDNVRTQDKLFKAQNSYQSQNIQRLQTERLEFINIGKDIMNKLNDAKKRIAGNLR